MQAATDHGRGVLNVKTTCGMCVRFYKGDLGRQGRRRSRPSLPLDWFPPHRRIECSPPICVMYG